MSTHKWTVKGKAPLKDAYRDGTSSYTTKHNHHKVPIKIFVQRTGIYGADVVTFGHITTIHLYACLSRQPYRYAYFTAACRGRCGYDFSECRVVCRKYNRRAGEKGIVEPAGSASDCGFQST